ncbi:MAG: 30S ribosomal protein S17 [Minisyncoccia bacterium]
MSKRILRGRVVSVKMKKTAVVEVISLKTHPKYRKKIKSTKKYKAHHEDLVLGVGDVVTIEESRPISKDKHWVIKTILSSPKTVSLDSEVTQLK